MDMGPGPMAHLGVGLLSKPTPRKVCPSQGGSPGPSGLQGTLGSYLQLPKITFWQHSSLLGSMSRGPEKSAHVVESWERETTIFNGEFGAQKGADGILFIHVQPHGGTEIG